MSTNETTTIGKIKTLSVAGSGPLSAQNEIRLQDKHGMNHSFFVFFDKPKGDSFLQLLNISFRAMWDQETVEIKSVLYNGDQSVSAITIL